MDSNNVNAKLDLKVGGLRLTSAQHRPLTPHFVIDRMHKRSRRLSTIVICATNGLSHHSRPARRPLYCGCRVTKALLTFNFNDDADHALRQRLKESKQSRVLGCCIAEFGRVKGDYCLGRL
ncbi:hypothetical protein CC2G_005275 [Coprinopsis cinerea AmutBmut pab1-1]|nr:hypothetical protein CC2G_005275 [Coprinopsis cinerea AmutBmut pab1-1]